MGFYVPDFYLSVSFLKDFNYYSKIKVSNLTYKK